MEVVEEAINNSILEEFHKKAKDGNSEMQMVEQRKVKKVKLNPKKQNCI